MWKCSDANGCGTGVSPFWFCVALPGLAAGSARIQGTNLPVGARPWLLTAAPAGADVRLRRSLRLIPGTIPVTVGRRRCLEKTAVVAHVRSHLPGGDLMRPLLVHALILLMRRVPHAQFWLSHVSAATLSGHHPAGGAYGIACTSIRSCPSADQLVLATSTSLLPECRIFCSRHHTTMNLSRS